MKLFLDTANLDDIREAISWGGFFRRGHNEITFSLIAHRDDHEMVRRKSRFINRGLTLVKNAGEQIC